MKTLLIFSLLFNPISQSELNSLNLSSVVYRITKFQNQPQLEFNLSGSGTAQARVRVCDNSLGCRDDTPSTIHQSQNVNFTTNGLNSVDILKFSRNNEAKRINIVYTNNLGQTVVLNFSISSAFPKSYSIVSTTLSKVISESSFISVNSSNVATTSFNRFDFRSFYLKQNQNQIINFKDYLISNGGVYRNLSGFVQLTHGLELSNIPKANSYYQLNFKTVPYQDKILIILDNYFIDTNSKELTQTLTSTTIPTNNIVLSSNYNKATVSNLIFNFRDVGEHGSNIRVTAPFTVNRNIFGGCGNAIICISKQPLTRLNYRRIINSR